MKKIIVIILVLFFGISSYTWSNEPNQPRKDVKARTSKDIDKANHPLGITKYNGMMSPKRPGKNIPYYQCVLRVKQNKD